VSGQHDWAFDLKYAGMQGPNPVLAARRLPIFLLNPVVFGMLGFPKALPVFGAGIGKAGDEKN
jgi:hypothetical protein